MNEIEKMYANANIDRRVCGTFANTIFTTDTQFKLLKVLGTNTEGDRYHFVCFDRDEVTEEWYISYCREFKPSELNNITFRYKDFSQALAGLVNTIWEKLTKDEQQQIREVL